MEILSEIRKVPRELLEMKIIQENYKSKYSQPEICQLPRKELEMYFLRKHFREQYPQRPMHSGQPISTLYGNLFTNEFAFLLGIGMKIETLFNVTILEYEGGYDVILNMPSWSFRTFAEVLGFIHCIAAEYCLFYDSKACFSAQRDRYYG
jgi:hypothetical protein